MAADHDFMGELHEQMLADEDAYARRHKAAQTLFNGGDPDADDLGGEMRAGYIPRTHLDDHRYYSLGLPSVDTMAGDIRPGEFVAIGASTGHGKSALGEHVALDISLRNRVVLFSLEMDRALAEERLLAKLMRVDILGVAAARYTKSDDYLGAVAELQRRDLLLVDPPPAKRTIRDLTRHAEAVTADVVIIDYASKIANWDPGKPANLIVGELWEWIKHTRTTVFLLAQTKRPGMPGGKRYRPTVHDFSDSREIENTATRAILLWRPFHGTRRDTIAELTLGKNRFGREFRAHTHWTGSTGDFHPMTEDEEKTAPCCRRIPRPQPERKRPAPSTLDPDLLMEM